MGYDAKGEWRAQSAIDRIRQHNPRRWTPNLIILDLYWFEENSDVVFQKEQWWDIYASLKASEFFKDIPVIAFSGQIDVQRSIDAGRHLTPDMRLFLKPMLVKQLVAGCQAAGLLAR